MKTQAIIRGGDVILDCWQNTRVKDLVRSNQQDYEGELIQQYEDRELWVRDALKFTNWEDLEKLSIIVDRNALLMWVIIGQEIDRSSQYPIRYIKMAIAIPK